MSERWVDRPGDVRSDERLDTLALGSYLDTLLGSAEGLRVRQYPSGFSNLTYAVQVEGREMILRRPPLGAQIKSAHDMGREFRILACLAPVYPKAPQPIAFCEDLEVLGAPFYLMERIEGVILRPRMPVAMHPAPEVMARTAAGWVDTLVELHAVDFEGAGLEGLGHPDGYVERQVRGWTRRWQAARTESVATIEQTAAWLTHHLPVSGPPSLIHNDFKYDNVVLDPEDWGRVVGVLDWEMATVGDPLMDLGTALGYWIDPEDSAEMQSLSLSPTTLDGNPGRAEIAARYLAASGRQTRSLVFYYVFGLFKIAVIVQQIYARYRQGLTRDPRFAGLDRVVESLGDAAQRAISRNRIDRLFA